MKRLSLFLVSGLWLLVSPASRAVIDINENGISDLFERQYNDDELFPETFDLQADTDSDGWTNAEEAAAGTDPFDPNPPGGYLRPEILHTPAVIGEEEGQPVIITQEAVTVSWSTLVGKQYTLQLSPDLSENWITIDEPLIGDGDIHEFGFTITGAADKRFWRVAVEDADTDGDTLTDAEEHTIGSSPYLADTDGDGIDDATAYAAGSDPSGDGSDADGDGVPDNQIYSVVFEVIHENIFMPHGVGFHSYNESDETNRYLTRTATETYTVTGSAKYPDVSGGEHEWTDTYLTGGSINEGGGVVSSESGTTFSAWKENNQTALGEDETLDEDETVVTHGEPVLTGTRIAAETTWTTPWTVMEDGETVRSGTEVITVTNESELSDGLTYPQLWNTHVKDRPLEETAAAKFGPLNWMEYDRNVAGDAIAAENIRNHFRNGDFDISGNVSFPTTSPLDYGSDDRIKTLRWRWVRFNPQSPFGYEYATPPAAVRKTFHLLVKQRDQLHLRTGGNGNFITDETTTKGIVPIECLATEGTQSWAEIPLSKFASYKLEDPANLAEIDFSKWGGSQVTIGNSPIQFDVFPPEPTDGQIANAEDDTWEIETFQIAADEPDFWIQANVMTKSLPNSGSIVPAGDGTTVKWEIIEGESDPGATLSEETTETEGGHTAVRLTMPTTPEARVKVRGKVTKLNIPTGLEDEFVTLNNPDGFAEVRTQFFEVVPGNASGISLTSSASSVPADGKSEVTVSAVVVDSEGNPVARGTDVNWRISGSGSILWRDHLVAGQDGTVEAIITAGTLGNKPQTITVEADGVIASTAISNTPVSVSSLTAMPESLDITASQTATITVTANGVEDGTEVTWRTSGGVLSQRTGKIQNGSAQTVLTAESGTVGNASVIAIIGDAIASCDVQFTSSAPISVEVGQPLIVRDESGDGTESVPLLYGGSQSVPFAANTPVIIRAPDHPGEWATVGFAGTNGVPGHRWGFETLVSDLSPSVPAGLSATFADGAILETDWQIISAGEGALNLPTTSSTATIAHSTGLALAEGSGMSFLIRPGEDDGTILSKAGEYQASLLSDGRLSFTLGSGQGATQVTSAHPLATGAWHQIDISVRSSRLHLDTGGLTVSAALAAPPPTGTEPLVIGGFTGHLDDLRFHHEQTGFAGISINATGLDSQNRVQLDANGEATITVSAETLGQGPPPNSLGQTVDVEVSVDQETVTAPKALTVTDKGTGVLIRAIAGKTAVRPLDLATADIAAHAAEFLKYGIRYDDPAAALPKDMGGDETARGETGYLIAIWIEERVDEAGIVRPLMSVSAQNLPEGIAKVLNCLLAEMMVSAGQRGDSQSLGDFIIDNNKELLLALQSLSAGNVDDFRNAAAGLDGDEAFLNGSAVAGQVGEGTLQKLAQDGFNLVGNGYDNFRAYINRQNWRIPGTNGTLVVRDRANVAADARRLQAGSVEAISAAATSSKDFIRLCSESLVSQNIITPEGAAALGFAYGAVEKIDELGQDLVQPELLAQAAMQLMDLTGSAVGGDEQAREALKEIGSLAAMTPISAVDESQQEWDQGHYFQAGANAVAVVEIALVAKFVKDLAVKSTRKALLWGRHRTTDWQATWAEVGKRAEALAFQKLERKGFKQIVPIRNDSNHGIDWVCRDRKGGIVFIEVKGHRMDARPRLSKSQEDMKAFTEDRLNKAVSKTGHWKNVSEKTINDAQSILTAIQRDGAQIKGYVINVDYAVSKLPRFQYFEWLNGVGNLVNPKP